MGPPEPLPEARGCEPHGLVQGPGHGHGRREGARGGRDGDRLRLDREHVAPRPRRMARPPASRSSSFCRPGKIAAGQAAPGPGRGSQGPRRPRQLRRRADGRSRARRAARAPDHPRQLGQPVPAPRPADGGLRGLRRPRRPAGRPGDPGRQRRQHQRLLDGLPRLPRGRRHRPPAPHVGVPGRRRSADRPRPPGRAPRDVRDGDPHRQPCVVGQGGRRPRRVGRAHRGRHGRRDLRGLPGRDRARRDLLRAGLGSEPGRRPEAAARTAGSTPAPGSSACSPATGSRTPTAAPAWRPSTACSRQTPRCGRSRKHWDGNERRPSGRAHHMERARW